jgi:hypothetical protein
VIPEIAPEASQETAPRVEFGGGPQHEGGIENFDGSDWETCLLERLNDRLGLRVVLSRRVNVAPGADGVEVASGLVFLMLSTTVSVGHNGVYRRPTGSQSPLRAPYVRAANTAARR